MTREDVQACLRIGASAVTILVLVGGPLGFALFTLDAGVKEATTRCESMRFAELADLRTRQVNQYTLYLNAKLTLLSGELGHDLRPDSVQKDGPDPKPVDVQKHLRDEAWGQVLKLGKQAQRALTEAENCPDYGGILE